MAENANANNLPPGQDSISEHEDQLRRANERIQILEQAVIERNDYISMLNCHIYDCGVSYRLLEGNYRSLNGYYESLEENYRSLEENYRSIKHEIEDIHRSLVWRSLNRYQESAIGQTLHRGISKVSKSQATDSELSVSLEPIQVSSEAIPDTICDSSSASSSASSATSEEFPALYEEHQIFKQTIPTELVPLDLPIAFHQGYNAIRFHAVEGPERPCDVPEARSSDFRWISFGVYNPSIKKADKNYGLFLGRNWHWLEYFKGALIRWMSDDATLIIFVEEELTAILSLQLLSFHMPRTIEIYSKLLEGMPDLEKPDHKTTVWLSSEEPEIDRDAVKRCLDELTENLSKDL